MNISFLSDEGSWKNEAIKDLAKRLRKKHHQVTVLHKAGSVPKGDILFILGFFKIVPTVVLNRNSTNLVVHESALPTGRGWSPVTWLVLKGAKAIPLTLFEAVDRVDAGKIYLRDKVKLRGDELLPEIQTKVAARILRLCERFVAGYPAILKRGVAQRGKATYYPKRKPEDSVLDPKKSIANQFNLLRTVNNEVYPAYFKLHGSTYLLKIERKSS